MAINPSLGEREREKKRVSLLHGRKNLVSRRLPEAFVTATLFFFLGRDLVEKDHQSLQALGDASLVPSTDVRLVGPRPFWKKENRATMEISSKSRPCSSTAWDMLIKRQKNSLESPTCIFVYIEAMESLSTIFLILRLQQAARWISGKTDHYLVKLHL